MIALIDGDALAYRCAASCSRTKTRLEELPLDIAISRLDEMVYSILNSVSADEYRIYLSGSENFRKIIYPDYKANRRNIIPPRWLNECREFLVREWEAELTAGYEADDGIGIAANEHSIICAYDKDLRQIPGQHYNFTTQTHDFVDHEQATRNFWYQVLQGDRADGVRSVGGMGPKKTDKALRSVPTSEMEACVSGYFKSRGHFIFVCGLLKVLRSEAEYREVLSNIEQGVYEDGLRESEREAVATDGSGEDSPEVS